MNDMTPHDPETGEVKIPAAFQSGQQSLAVQLAMAELNQDVVTARSFPRSVATVMRNITQIVMLDEPTAKECVYAVPRDGKTIRGPSIRLAEIIASMWGNCHCASRIVHIDHIEKYVESEGIFHDLETGLKRTARTRKPIRKRDGGIYSLDMIMNAGNAAASISMREAILKGVPKAVWRQAFEHAEKVIRGDIATLAERRGDAIKALLGLGVTPDRVFASINVAGIEEIGLDELADLFAMYQGVKSGETNVDDVFPAIKSKAEKPTDLKGSMEQLAGAQQKPAESKAAPASKPKEQKNSEPAASPGSDSGDGAAAEKPSPGATPQAPAQQPGDGDFSREELIAKARADGAEAKKAGRVRKSMPVSYRQDPDLSESWLTGWETGEAERQPGEEG